MNALLAARLTTIAAIAVAATVLVVVLGVPGAKGEGKDLTGTAHNVGSAGQEPCVLCHVPAEEGGETFWAQPPNSTGLFAGIRPLCFSCHDGTVTASAAYVFNPTTPTHLSNPAVRGEDCDRCHDPHDRGYGKFLKWPMGADMCFNCHTQAGPTNHPVDVDAIAYGVIPTDSTFDPSAGDFSGTRLFNQAGTGPGNYIKCMTCHSPHGGAPGTALMTVAFEKVGHESFLPLCLNCHFNRAPGAGGLPR